MTWVDTKPVTSQTGIKSELKAKYTNMFKMSASNAEMLK